MIQSSIIKSMIFHATIMMVATNFLFDFVQELFNHSIMIHKKLSIKSCVICSQKYIVNNYYNSNLILSLITMDLEFKKGTYKITR